MSMMGVEYSAMQASIADWADLAERMDTLGGDLADTGTAGLPESVQGAAAAFLTAWSGYASDSAEIARNFSACLQACSDNYLQADAEATARFDDLDGSLGA